MLGYIPCNLKSLQLQVLQTQHRWMDKPLPSQVVLTLKSCRQMSQCPKETWLSTRNGKFTSPDESGPFFPCFCFCFCFWFCLCFCFFLAINTLAAHFSCSWTHRHGFVSSYHHSTCSRFMPRAFPLCSCVYMLRGCFGCG